MRSQRKGGLSATTQVKVSSPEITNIARGQGFHFLEASIAACVKGEYVCDVPGSESVAGKPTVHIGTWESHIAPDRSSQQAEEARRKYADDVQHIEQALRERFAKFDLELHPVKTRVISFGRYERENAKWQNQHL